MPGSTASDDLAQLLRASAQEFSGSQSSDESSAEIRITVEGSPCALSPVLQDELYRIGRELLRNAFRHARANLIQVEIRYATNKFRLRIRDDGVGMVLSS